MFRTARAAIVAFALIVRPTAADAQYKSSPVDTAHGNRESHLLWPEGAPGAVGSEAVDKPKITVYRAPASMTATAATTAVAAMVVCPGGSYMSLASDHEGRQVAEWLNTLGVTAFVVQYRLGPRYGHPAPLQDAQRAIRLVRARAAEWRVDPSRVGILGFSAGGHLAATAATHFDDGRADGGDPVDRFESRPDLAVLVYPVITFTTAAAVHSKSLGNLLGKQPDPKLREFLSNELQITSRTPPTFLVHTDEDATVTPENSILFYEALRRAKIPAEVHVFVKGSHGLGLGGKGTAFAAWPDLCAAWMRELGFLRP